MSASTVPAPSSAASSASAAGSSSSHHAAIPGKPTIIFGGNYGENVDGVSRWVVLYAPYIDSRLKEKEGRKIGKEKCVEDPKILEMFDCAQLLGFEAALEIDKAYCRDYWKLGRIRVRLVDNDKNPIRQDIPNRRVLYAKIAGLIPEHRTRSEKAKKVGGANSQTGGKASGGKASGGKGGGGGGKGGSNAGGKTQPKKKKKGKR